MRYAALGIVLSIVFLAAAPLAASPFGDAVASIERLPGMERVYVPFMGLARVFMRTTGWNGVHDIRLAVFETAGGSTGSALQTAALDRAPGRDWQRIVHSRRTDGRERSSIFAKPEGKRMRLLIVSVEPDEAAVIEVLIDPERMDAFIADKGEHLR